MDQNQPSEEDWEVIKCMLEMKTVLLKHNLKDEVALTTFLIYREIERLEAIIDGSKTRNKSE